MLLRMCGCAAVLLPNDKPSARLQPGTQAAVCIMSRNASNPSLGCVGGLCILGPPAHWCGPILPSEQGLPSTLFEVDVFYCLLYAVLCSAVMLQVSSFQTASMSAW
jgi:hypothetical protein